MLQKAPIYLAWLAVVGALLLEDPWAGPLVIAAGALLCVGVSVGALESFAKMRVDSRMRLLAVVSGVFFMIIGVAWIVAS